MLFCRNCQLLAVRLAFQFLTSPSNFERQLSAVDANGVAASWKLRSDPLHPPPELRLRVFQPPLVDVFLAPSSENSLGLTISGQGGSPEASSSFDRMSRIVSSTFVSPSMSAATGLRNRRANSAFSNKIIHLPLHTFFD